MRFVFLSFVFLALAFYELSGGASFDPAAQRTAAIETRVAQAEERRLARGTAVASTQKAPERTARKETAPANTEDTVTRASLSLVSFQTATEADTLLAAPEPLADRALTQADRRSIAELATETAATETPLSLAALETASAPSTNNAFAGSRQVARSSTPTQTTDIRIVKGDLVNMRSGPGTDYDVVDQLSQATEVEVLSSNGSGWVELRPVDGGPTGWMAEFLLTGG